MTGLSLERLTVALERCHTTVSVGSIIKDGLPPFQEVSQKLAARIGRMAEMLVEPGSAELYRLPEPSKVSDVWALCEGTASEGTMSWGQFQRLLGNHAALGSFLPSGTRLACQMQDEAHESVTAMVKIQWGEDGQGQHFMGTKPENDPNFRWYEGTVFMVRTS